MSAPLSKELREKHNVCYALASIYPLTCIVEVLPMVINRQLITYTSKGSIDTYSKG